MTEVASVQPTIQMHRVVDPVATAEIPDDAAGIAEQESLPSGRRREPFAVFDHGEKRVLVAALEYGVNERRERDPAQKIKRGFREDQDLQNA